MTTVNVSVPTAAVTETVHVSGFAPDAGVQLGELGVRLATTGVAPPTEIATDCVAGEINCGRLARLAALALVRAGT
jgi:hypothetical protein